MSIGFILDTCVISETRKPRPHPGVIEFLNTDGPFYMPIGTLVELQVGINEVCSEHPMKAVRLSNWYQRVLSAGMPILQTDQDVGNVLSTLLADPRLKNLHVPDERKKVPRYSQDLQIAAASLVHKIPIATFDVKDFMRINTCHPLPGVFDPMTSTWHARIENFEPLVMMA